jgi:hypothetical protein
MLYHGMQRAIPQASDPQVVVDSILNFDYVNDSGSTAVDRAVDKDRVYTLQPGSSFEVADGKTVLAHDYTTTPRTAVTGANANDFLTNTTAPWSVEACFNARDWQTSVTRYMCFGHLRSATGRGFSMIGVGKSSSNYEWINVGSQLDGTSRTRFKPSQAGAPSVPPTGWQHWIILFDGVSASWQAGVTAYYNGVLANKYTPNNFGNYGNSTYIEDSHTTSFSVNAQHSCLRVWDRLLTAEEITLLASLNPHPLVYV